MRTALANGSRSAFLVPFEHRHPARPQVFGLRQDVFDGKNGAIIGVMHPQVAFVFTGLVCLFQLAEHEPRGVVILQVHIALEARLANILRGCPSQQPITALLDEAVQRRDLATANLRQQVADQFHEHRVEFASGRHIGEVAPKEPLGEQSGQTAHRITLSPFLALRHLAGPQQKCVSRRGS